MRIILLLAAIVAITIGISACAGSVAPSAQGGAPVLTVDDEVTKEAMYSYKYFYLDSVNHQSGPRWTVQNNAGHKEFMLSNTCHSAPKSWILGCNYWNREDDSLTSNAFT